jgi:hypothetical protein
MNKMMMVLSPRGLLRLGLLVGGLSSASTFAQESQKLAQTGLQFLSVVSDARAAAMAEAMTSLQIGSGAMFFNPAGMAEMTGFIDGTASLNKWIADINHNTFSLAIRPAEGNYGVFGLSAQTVDYGEFYGTVVSESDKGYEDTGTFQLNAIALGLGYAKQLTDRFSVGGQIRWVHQDLGESTVAVNIRPDPADSTGVDRIADASRIDNTLSPLVFDFGTQFRTGIKSLVFGMSVRNFSKEVKYAEEGFQAPLVFNLGISMNVMDLMKAGSLDQSLRVSVDATHFRDHPEQIKVGLEYQLLKIFSLRGGYVANNYEDGFSFGAGVSHSGFTFDYAYTPFGVFDKVQRMTARFSL